MIDPHGIRSLMSEIAFHVNISFHSDNGWPGQLSANLAIASLLCRAADGAYQNGVDDNESEYWTGRGDLGPYPGRKP